MMKINFFEEYPTEENMKKLDMIDWPAMVFIAASSIKDFESLRDYYVRKYPQITFGWCKTGEDWRCFMRANGVPEERIADRRWLEQNGFSSLAFYLRKQFEGKWIEYRSLVNLPAQRGRASKWTRIVRQCKESADFLTLFDTLGIPRDTWTRAWRISQSKEWSGLYQAIISTEGFKPYSKFLAVLGISPPPAAMSIQTIDQAEDLVRRVCAAEGLSDLRELMGDWNRFEELGRRHPGLDRAIVLLSQ
jgi:hypothetical protein